MKILKLAFIGLIVFQNANAKRPDDCLTRYSRACFPHWIDEDGDCIDTRGEVLQRENTSEAVVKNCKVVAGEWFDVYSGKVYNNPSLLDIDHIIPLKEAWLSGGNGWSESKSTAFANDFENLLAVSITPNRQKKEKDPSKWLPPQKEYVCEYIERWVYLKKKYNLKMDSEEKKTIEEIQKKC